MSPLARLFAAPLALIVISAVSPARAQDAVGRYQMISIPAKPGSFDTRVMILDTSEGHLWQWWETPSISGGTPGSGITYLGKVGPGAAAAGGTATNHPSPPLQIIPHH